MRPAALARGVLEALRLPEVIIDLGGDPACRSIFDAFTRPHPRFRVIQSKRYGVALAPVPEGFEDYLAGRQRQALRTNRKKALGGGFTFSRIDPLAHLDEILSINRSATERQGRPMPASYLELDELRQSFAVAPRVFGVLDGGGVLRAYLDLRVCGDVAILGRLLGHAEVLDEGVMYLLVSEGVREASELRATGGSPRWVMYDTWYGGRPGLRYFKERLGFAPHRVRWTWSS
jgi:hypothetical protein